MAALLGVLGSGLLNGVLFGVALSMVLIIRRASRPRVGKWPRARHVLLRRLGVTRSNERVPGVLVVRSEGAMLYFNVDHVRDRLLALLGQAARAPRLVMLFMGNVPYVDLAGAELLADLQTTLRRAASSSGSPKRTERCARRCAASTWSRQAASPKRIRR